MAELALVRDGGTGMTHRFTAVLAGVKLEIVNLTTPAEDDYFYTRLQRPVAAIAGGTTAAVAGNVVAEILGVTPRKITITANDNAGNVGVIVIGY